MKGTQGNIHNEKGGGVNERQIRQIIKPLIYLIAKVHRNAHLHNIQKGEGANPMSETEGDL